MKIVSTPTAPTTLPEEGRSAFDPPEDLENAVMAFILETMKFSPSAPSDPPPSLAEAPDSLDRAAATEYITRTTRWKEFYQPQIGQREAVARLLTAGVRHMRGYVAYVHKGKVEKLSEAQFMKLQEYEYRLGALEAEIKVLESLSSQQQQVYAAASRNLTGAIVR
jgi:hypothetical protein